MHTSAMPTGGGLAIAGGVVAGVTALAGLHGALPSAMETLPFWAGALLMLGTGFWDDTRGLDPKSKFLLQLVAAYFLLHAGVRLEIAELVLVNGGGYERALYVIPLSLIWVVGIINAVNLIDGLDGLATGVLGIAFLAGAALFGVIGQVGLVAFGIMVAAVLGGFLLFNFKPASIFMGDSGSLFLGYLLAAYSMQGSLHTDPVVALLIPPMLLGVPVLETGVTMARRLLTGRAIFAPDKNHIHHRLLAYGTETNAVLTLYLLGSWFGTSAVLMALLPAAWGYILIAITGVLAGGFVWHLGCLAPVQVAQEEKEPQTVPVERQWTGEKKGSPRVLAGDEESSPNGSTRAPSPAA